ncbi:MAG: CFI-box-CTERM domain-containing protein, partial [Nanoarchaeota archaeon]
MAKTKDDEDYERGVKVGKEGNVFTDFTNNLSRGVPLPTSKAEEIFNKGYDYGAEHRYDSPNKNPSDSDSSSSGESGGGGGCYLTTACVSSRGLSDNCLELNVLRSFRDRILLQTPSGRKAVKKYYQIAPEVVQSINEKDNSSEI